MIMSRSIQHSISLAAGALVIGASLGEAQWGRPAPRQGTELYQWTGRVDREVQIVMRGNRVWTNNVGWTEPGNERSRMRGSLPRRPGDVAVFVSNGRGRVDVIQQPASSNGYTAIVRIQDPRSGAARYNLTAYWQGYDRGGDDVYSRPDDRMRGRRVYEMRRRDGDWKR